MQLISLIDRRPEPYKEFMAYNKKENEYFINLLILSPYNKFYVAGREFTHWVCEE